MYAEGKTFYKSASVENLDFPRGTQYCILLESEDLAINFHFRDQEFLFAMTISSWACLSLCSSERDVTIS